MNVTIEPSALGGVISAPPSKSYMHRMLICAALADKPTVINTDVFSEDTLSTINCLRALGAKAETADGKVKITPIDKEAAFKRKCVLDCSESGSTFRFMLPVSAALGAEATFTGSRRLGERPILPLVGALEKDGIKFTSGKESIFPCTLEGRLKGGEYNIEANISSQFLSGLLLALGITGGEIVTNGEIKSAPYVEMTLSAMEKFSSVIERTNKGYRISSDCYKSPLKAEVEGDFSNAAFWITAGVLGGDIICKNISESTLQGDRAIVDILKRMGADIEFKDGVRAKKSVLHATEIDAQDIPDLVPVLCVAACGAIGKTVIYNTERLRHKESDRVKSSLSMVRALGGEIFCDENSVTIIGGASLRGGTLDCFNDHRIAMSGAVASVICSENVTLIGSHAVKKSYPDFFEKFKELGGKLL